MVVGLVDESHTPDELPDLDRLAAEMGAPPGSYPPGFADVARTVLREMGVDRLLLIRYLMNGEQQVTFFALHSVYDDKWRDLKGQELVVKRYANQG